MAENQTSQHETLDDVESHVPEQLHPIIEAVFKYHKQIIAGVVGVVVIAAIYAGMSAYNQRALADAQMQLGTILIEASGDDKIARLETLLGNAPSSAKPAILLELAQASMNNAEYDKAEGYWNQLVGETDNDLGLVARMGKAKCLSLAGKNAEAVTILSDLAASAPEAFTVPVYRQLAVAAEQAGHLDRAISAYQKLTEFPIPDKPFIEYKIAQLEAI